MNPIRAARLLAVLSLMIASQALAEPSPATFVNGDEPTPGLKSPTTALALSLFGTAIPLAVCAVSSSGEFNSSQAEPAILGVAAYVIGPSLGHFYSGRSGRGFEGMGFRTLALVGLGVAALAQWNDPTPNLTGPVVAVTVLGLGSALYDIASAPASARNHNAKVRTSHAPVVSLAPIGPTHAPGLRVDVPL